MNRTINDFCAEKSAYAPRKNTDTFFPLPAGSNVFTGALMDSIRYIEKIQLLDADLWKLFVNQFRQGSVDDSDRGWRCEYWGKMMRGGCFTYQTTRDAALYQALETTVRDMLTAQDALGRFSTYSPEKEFDGWDIWGRKYILLGMQYFLEICPDETLKADILAALRRHADYMIEKLGPADEGKLEINEATSHWHGLNSSSVLEPFVRLYNLTGEPKYLDFAAYIVERGGTSIANIFEMAYEDRLDPYQYPVTKAYEMMSCFEGLLEYYRVTGIEKWRDAVVRFARRVYASDITVIGCAGCTHELFDHSAVRQLDVTEKGIMQETCVTVTWMKLCYQVLCLTGEAAFADHMEQSIYNALIGSINTDGVTINGGLPFDSYSPLLPGLRGRKMGGYKVMENGTFYGCCACIGAAGLGLIGMSSVSAAKDGLYVNLFLNGTVKAFTPADQPLTIKTATAYPAGGTVRMTVGLNAPERFTLGVRIPAWSEKTALSVNGKPVSVKPGDYARLDREWNNGDTVLLTLDLRVMPVRPEDYGVDSKDAPFIALRRGPIVLARDARTGDFVDRAVSPVFNEDGSVRAVSRAETPFKCVVAQDIALTDGSVLPMVDYASAGKTWTDESRMAAWFAVK